MSEIGKELKNIILAGIGAVATTAEKSESLLKELIKKGELTVEQGKVLNEELKHKVCKTDSCCKNGEGEKDAKQVDVENMTKEERSELKRRIEELEKNDQNGGK